MGKLPPNSNTASQPFNGNREQRLLCISLSGENLYKIEIFWPLLFFHLSTHAQTLHSPLPKRMHLKSAAQTHWKPVFHSGGDGLWGCSHKGKILWTNSRQELEIPKMSHSVHQAHSHNPPKQDSQSWRIIFSKRLLFSWFTLEWNFLHCSAGTIFQYSLLLLALIHPLLPSVQHNLKYSKNSSTSAFCQL